MSRALHTSALLLLCLFALSLQSAWAGAKTARQPNIVIFFTDDQGYADVGCYGARKFRTPNMDRLARAGIRFRSFYLTEAVCSASHASLLTGCYAVRVGLQGALNHTSTTGINDKDL